MFLIAAQVNKSILRIISWTSNLNLLLKQKLGSLVNQADLDEGRVYPPVPAIHEVTIKIAAHLAEHLYKTKKAWNYPGKNENFFFALSVIVSYEIYLEPNDKEEFIRMQLYDTSYEYFGPKRWQWPEKHSSARTVPTMDENLCLES